MLEACVNNAESSTNSAHDTHAPNNDLHIAEEISFDFDVDAGENIAAAVAGDAD